LGSSRLPLDALILPDDQRDEALLLTRFLELGMAVFVNHDMNSGEVSHFAGDSREGQREIERGLDGLRRNRNSVRFSSSLYSSGRRRVLHSIAGDGPDAAVTMTLYLGMNHCALISSGRVRMSKNRWQSMVLGGGQ
jgi:hypothetical protein